MIKTKLFCVAGNGDSPEFEMWQKEHNNVAVIDTKIVTQTYTENRLLITYRELPVVNQTK